MNIIILLLMGLVLSVDTFSLSVILGTYNISFNKMIVFSFLVSFFHFSMTIIGAVCGSCISKIMIFNPNKLLGIILMFIGIEMILNISKNDTIHYDFYVKNMVLYAFSVSLDSLMLGIGINAITSSPVIAAFIFSIVSGSLTIIGLSAGKLSYNIMGRFANYVAILILLIMSIFHLFIC